LATPPSCIDGTTQQDGSRCDGHGNQIPGDITNCSPYTCAGGECRTTCSDPSHCAPGRTCTSGFCV
jgi:hypothetical protein